MKASTLFDVTGHAAFVTGGAHGLGRAMAEAMAANGAHVTLADIDEAGLKQAAAAIRAAGGAADTIALDVADLDALVAAIDMTAEKHGRLDAVFANAGISAGAGITRAEGQLDGVAREKWDRVLHINLTSVFATVQAAARHMKPRRQGRIVVTASIGGMRAEELVGYAYAATKAAAINLVRQAALELAPHNVLINAIAPGPFFTNIGDGRLRREPELRDRFERTVPMGRIAEPDELKGLALFLASPANTYVTGACIPIDGGATAG